MTAKITVLHPQEEAFVRYVLSGLPQSKAFLAAGYKMPKNLKVLHTQASNLIRRPRIAERLDKARAAAAKSVMVDATYILERLRWLYEYAAEMVPVIDIDKHGNVISEHREMRNPVEARLNMTALGNLVMGQKRHVKISVTEASSLSDDELADIIRRGQSNGSGNGAAEPSDGSSVH